MAAGTGSGGGTSGAAAGSSLFLMTGTTTTFNPTTALTINGSIADDSAASLPGGGYTGGSAAGAGIIKAGAGTLTLAGANTYAGGTAINGGTLVAAHATAGNDIDALGTGTVTLANGALRSTVTGTLETPLTFSAGTATIAAATDKTLTLTGFFSIGSGATSLHFGSATDQGDNHRRLHELLLSWLFVGGGWRRVACRNRQFSRFDRYRLINHCGRRGGVGLQ